METRICRCSPQGSPRRARAPGQGCPARRWTKLIAAIRWDRVVGVYAQLPSGRRVSAASDRYSATVCEDGSSAVRPVLAFQRVERRPVAVVGQQRGRCWACRVRSVTRGSDQHSHRHRGLLPPQPRRPPSPHDEGDDGVRCSPSSSSYPIPQHEYLSLSPVKNRRDEATRGHRWTVPWFLLTGLLICSSGSGTVRRGLFAQRRVTPPPGCVVGVLVRPEGRAGCDSRARSTPPPRTVSVSSRSRSRRGSSARRLSRSSQALTDAEQNVEQLRGLPQRRGPADLAAGRPPARALGLHYHFTIELD